MTPKKKVSRLEIYRLATGIHKVCGSLQFSAAEIGRYFGVSKQYISKILREMEDDGYLDCDNPEGKPKFYSSTIKIYDGEKPIDKDGYVSTKSGRRPGIIVQKARYKITIEREYRDFFRDKKHWDWGNCRCLTYPVKVFDNLDDFEFRKVGKNTLVVIVPGICFKKHELSIAKHTMFWIAYEALKWFAKKGKIQFDWKSLHLCQKPHVGRATMAAWAKRVANDWSLSIDGKMLDSSSGKADWECLVFDEGVVDAVDVLENWENVATWQGDIDGLHKKFNQFEEVTLPALHRSIDNILKEMKNVKKMLTPPSISKDPNDPSFG